MAVHKAEAERGGGSVRAATFDLVGTFSAESGGTAGPPHAVLEAAFAKPIRDVADPAVTWHRGSRDDSVPMRRGGTWG